MIKIFPRIFGSKYRNYYPYVPIEIDLRLKLPRKYLDKLKVLNVGLGTGYSGIARQIPFLDFGYLVNIDVHKPYLDAAMCKAWDAKDVRFIKADIRDFDTSDFDVVMMFDVLEHLPKEDSLKVMDSIKGKQIIFGPLEKVFRENTFGAESQDHLSFWEEKDYIERGYKVDVLKGFHQEGENIFDAIWAVK